MMAARNPLTGNFHSLLRRVGRSRSATTTTAHLRVSRNFPIRSPTYLSRSFANASSYGRVTPPSAHGVRLFSRHDFGFKHSALFSSRVSSGGGGSVGSGNGGSGGAGAGGGGGGSAGGSNWSFLSWYMSLLAKHPVMTKAITSALLTLVGDLICQLVIDQVPSLDLKRTSIFTLLGLVLVGPTLHFWYFSLSKLVTTRGAYGAFLRLLLDQFLFAPIFIGTFLSTLITLEGRPSDVIPKLQQEWFSSVLANWQLWIPFQFLNFRFVPQQFQVLAANFIALIWNVILSYKAHKEVVAK